MEQFIILHNTSDHSFTYTKTLSVNDAGELVTTDGIAFTPGPTISIMVGFDPRPLEIRPEVREANGLPPLGDMSADGHVAT